VADYRPNLSSLQEELCVDLKNDKDGSVPRGQAHGNIDEFETRGLAHASVIANQVRCHVYVFVKWSEIGVAVSNGDQPGTIALGW
jgi:hypothetical protein